MTFCYTNSVISMFLTESEYQRSKCHRSLHWHENKTKLVQTKCSARITMACVVYELVLSSRLVP